MGSTTLKLSLKLYENFNPSRNSISPQVSIGQSVKVFDKWDLSNTFSADYLRARDDSNDEKNYKMRHGITLTNMIKNVDLTTNLSYAIKDTMKQKGSRGNEININPSVELSHEFNAQFSGSLEYAYTRNYSRSKSQYQYSKHEIKSVLDFRF